MSYERDPDRSTRGPGAIAALDRPGGRRDQRRVMRAQATIARDRAMSAVTRGALGRIALDKPPGSGISIVPKIPIKVAAPPPPLPLPVGPVMVRFPDSPPPSPVPLPMPVTTMKPPTTVESPPIIPIITPVVDLPPLALPPIPGPSGGKSSGGSGGMSSGAGTVMTSGGVRPPIQVTIGPDAPLPDVAVAEDHTTRNLLLVGGGALALYLLLRKRGR